MHTKNNRIRQKHRVNVPATNPQSYWQRAVYQPLIDHLIQEMNDRLLSQEDRFLGQYLFPKKLQGLSNDFQDKMYAAYTNDLTDKRACDSEMLLWKTKWLHSTVERPATLSDTLDCINLTLYRNVNTILKILLTMPVSTATPERSFSTMRRGKTYLVRTTMKAERLSVHALMHVYRDTTINGEAIRAQSKSRHSLMGTGVVFIFRLICPRLFCVLIPRLVCVE